MGSLPIRPIYLLMFTVYRTTNKINGRFYHGVHKTDNPNDGYLGSGNILKHAVHKYGEGNFVKEILLCMDSREEAYDLEKEVIRLFRADPRSMNIHEGGRGGFDYINSSGLSGYAKGQALRDKFAGINAVRLKRKNDPAFDQRMKDLLDRARAAAIAKGCARKSQPKAAAAWLGCKHSDDTRFMMSEARSRQVMMAWVTDGKESLHILKSDVDAAISCGWTRGKKIKPGFTQDGKRIPVARRRAATYVCGTTRCYKKFKCRCSLCRAANRDERREHRRRDTAVRSD